MTVEYANYQQSQLYGLRHYYFSASGAIDSIAYLAAAGYEHLDFTQLFFHTNGKTDSCIIVDANRTPTYRTSYNWINDHEYSTDEIELKDGTRTKSTLVLNEQYRDWKRTDKVYKNGKLIAWHQYENTLSKDGIIMANFKKDMLTEAEEYNCAEYFSFDNKGNFLDAKQYSICADSSIWIRYKKRYEYHGGPLVAKDNGDYTIGNVPQLRQFQVLTQRETRIDSVMQQHAIEGRQHIKDGKFFVADISEQEKQDGVDYFEASMQPYRDNRSRYFLQDWIADRPVRNEDTLIEVMTTPCDCYMDNDTAKIRMGIWVFGGFSFAINLYQNQYDVTYWEDTHKQFIYKQQLSDAKMMDNITVGMKEQRLVMQSRPTFTIGEKMTGYLDMITNKYYKAEDENAELKKHNTKGEVYFTCTLRKKVIGDN